MKNKKVKIAYLLTLFIFLFTYIGGIFTNIESYAYDKTYVTMLSSSKPSSGSFKSSTKGSSKSYKSTIKPDSGSFSTKPNINNSNSGSSSTIKPDSGSFSTSPKNNSNSSGNSNNNSNNKNNKGYGGSNSSRPIFGGSYYGGYSPFRRVFFGYGMSSWIIKLVLLITAIIVIYIIIDYIRSRRD